MLSNGLGDPNSTTQVGWVEIYIRYFRLGWSQSDFEHVYLLLLLVRSHRNDRNRNDAYNAGIYQVHDRYISAMYQISIRYLTGIYIYLDKILVYSLKHII